MNWKDKLRKYENNKKWKLAIELIQNVINEEPNNLDAYLSAIYLLMNILVEEDYDIKQHDYYAGLIKKYFIESYSKFSFNSEYLFYIGKIAYMAEWYFDIEIEDAQKMMKEASNLDPTNLLYKWAYYVDLDMRILNNKKNMILYAKQVLSEPTLKKELKSKGALGKYLLDMLEYWSKEAVSIQ